ncbi:MAG: DUF342 domain-containing protein [Desulfamplus sp.]|nr:DUF342 domain-containing protein [Desulfamplus sp.]
MPDNNTILIVDDQESIIKSLKRLLLPEPYNILSAPDGETALKLINEHKSNLLASNSLDSNKLDRNSNGDQQGNVFLIISDQRMPNMTGTQFLEKTVEILPDAIRFILSGYADRDDIVKALNQGVAHRYLTKPWNNDELLIMIRQAHESPEKIRRFINTRGQELPEINIMDKEIRQFDEHRKDIFLGRVALHHGFITQEELDKSLTAMQGERQAGRNVSLENILFERGIISSEDMGKIVAVTRRRMGKTFAKTAMQNFGISQSDIEKGLAIQAQEFSNTSTCRLLGDILVAEKIITEEQKESIIIDQIYSERELVSSGAKQTSTFPIDRGDDTDNAQNKVRDEEKLIGDETESDKDKLQADKTEKSVNSELTLKRRKKKFFHQRALDKLFCKSAIKRNFATESEILKALEEQLLNFTKTFEIKLVKDILVERSIISQSQAQTIVDAILQQGAVKSDSVGTEKGVGSEKGVGTEKEVEAEKIERKRNEPFEVAISNDELEATILLVDDFDIQEDITTEKLTITSAKSTMTSEKSTKTPEKPTMTPEKLKEMLAIKYNIVYGLVDDVAIELFLRKLYLKKDKLASSISPTPHPLPNGEGDNNYPLPLGRGGEGQNNYLESSIKKNRFVIARGKPVKLGRNALIKYYFENENTRFGKELDSGKFDYRYRSEIPNINQGTLLAEKIPYIPAINGITVKGVEIAAPTPIDVNINCGQGVELTKDGLRAIAIANGKPDITLSGKISVLPEKIVKGNVDFRTGNVKFSGDIVVQGTILPGFSVTGCNLTVNDIDEADVNITNTVSVKNNINSSLVKTGVLLTAQIIKKSKIIAHGDVIVQKEIIDSTIITSGKVIVPRGRIIASTIHAAKGIEVMNIGSEVSTPCDLFLGSDDHAKEVLKVFSTKINTHKEQLVKLEAVQKQYNNQSLKQLNDLSELSRLQERLLIEKRKTLEDKKVVTSAIVKKQMDEFLVDLDKRALKMDESINTLFDKNDLLQTKISELATKIRAIRKEMQGLLKEKNSFKIWYDAQKEEAHKKGICVSVQGTIFAGTQITGTSCSMLVKDNIKNSKIQQVTNINDPNNPFQEMLVLPLSSRGKPHVYRT